MFDNVMIPKKIFYTKENDYYIMKNILVTGAEGFIGSHLVELLVKKKYNVKALVFYNFSISIFYEGKCEVVVKIKIQ